MKTFIEKMPKTEIHLHLEGAVPVDTLWELMKKYKKEKEIEEFKNFKNNFKYIGFKEFLDKWVWVTQFLKEYEDFTFLTESVLKELIGLNYRYVELFFSPARLIEKKLEPARITEAIYTGIKKYSNDIDVSLIPDLSRDFGEKQAMFILENINEVQDMNIKGIGLGGTETLFSSNTYINVFEKARKFGLFTTAHAGENAGPDAIWQVIKVLKIDRIGHCTTAIQDNKLVEFLKENQIPIELCPISNYKTGVVKSFKDHPVKKYFDKGLNITINTDDPAFFNNNLNREFQMLHDTFAFGKKEFKKLSKNAINSAWCDSNVKEKLNKEIDEYFISN